MNFKVFGYVLMDNHYHFIIQTFDKPLSKIMHQVNNVYSKYYNYKYKHVGHVFQGRYKSIHIQDEGYIMCYKLAYIKAAYDLKYTFDEIGRSINISGSAAYDLLKRLTPIIE